jgi:tRNA1(Val) A37 N6-methylase TrmN6
VSGPGAPPRPRPPREQVARWLAGGWLLEHRQGYRFSPELELLPAFFGPGEPQGRVVELGSGNGALLFAAASQGPTTSQLLGLERQPQLVRLATANARLRGSAARTRFVLADIRQPPLAAGVADWVLLNPPFYPAGWGRESRTPERHRSTHELAGGLGDFLATTGRVLRPGGRAVVVYGPERLAELLGELPAAGLWPRRLRLVVHRPRGTLARLFLEAVRLPPAGTAGLPAPLRTVGLQVDTVELDYAAARDGLDL